MKDNYNQDHCPKHDHCAKPDNCEVPSTQQVPLADDPIVSRQMYSSLSNY